MWGNWLGWTISAVLLAVTGAGFYHLAVPPAESSPAHLIPDDLLRNIMLPEGAEKIVPPGKHEGDAGPLYLQAIIRYRANPAPFADPIHAPSGSMPSIDLLRQAADMKRMTLFETRPQYLVNYNNEYPELEALNKISDAADTIGLGARLDGKYDDAKQLFNSVFALGRHLFDERVTWREMSAGIGMMSDASQNLAKVADDEKDGARAAVLRHLQEELDKYRAELQDKVASPLTNPVESYAGKYSGDIFAIAKDASVERVWRVAAILHLGRYRWNVADGHRGDQVWGHRALKSLDGSIDPANTDPVIRSALDAAINLTLEQQRKSIAM
jgi:hypothetical protein